MFTPMNPPPPPLKINRPPKCFFTLLIMFYITSGFYGGIYLSSTYQAIVNCVPSILLFVKICHKDLSLNLFLQMWLKYYYTTTMQNQCNHKYTWALVHIKKFYIFISHMLFVLWVNLKHDVTPRPPLLPWDSLSYPYAFEFMHVGIHEECKK